jgi:hypothetical protein
LLALCCGICLPFCSLKLMKNCLLFHLVQYRNLVYHITGIKYTETVQGQRVLKQLRRTKQEGVRVLAILHHLDLREFCTGTHSSRMLS